MNDQQPPEGSAVEHTLATGHVTVERIDSPWVCRDCSARAVAHEVLRDAYDTHASGDRLAAALTLADLLDPPPPRRGPNHER